MKLILFAAVAFVVWKFVMPNVTTSPATPVRRSVEATQASGNDCTDGAARASDVWGRGIGRFANSPDREEWSRFFSEIDQLIDDAEKGCACASRSCGSVRDAMSDLRDLVSDFDRAIRDGKPVPDNAVQRQERIDDLIHAAARE